MKHLENEFSQNHSLKRLSCSAASGIKPNIVIFLSKQGFKFSTVLMLNFIFKALLLFLNETPGERFITKLQPIKQPTCTQRSNSLKPHNIIHAVLLKI